MRKDRKELKYDASWFIEALDSIRDLVLIKGDRSKLLWANRAFREHYGMSNQELLDLIDSPHSDPDDTVQYVKDDHHVYTTGETLDIPSEPVTNAQGDVRYFHTIKSAIPNRHGETVRTIGISRLICDSNALEQSELSRSKKKQTLAELRALVHNIPLAVGMFDAQRRFICCSQVWLDLFECENTDIIGSFYEVEFEELLPIAGELTHAISAQATASKFERTICTPSGKTIVGEISIQPWLLPSGEAGGAIALVHDITRLKESEESLRQANDELSQFNYRVSHDLMGPLRTIRGYLNMCDEEFDSEPQLVRDLHGRIKHSVNHLTGLVQAVLDLARTDASLNRRSAVAVKTLVDKVLQNHRLTLDKDSIDITLNVDEEVIHREPVRIEQILENLISNSVKYCDPDKDRSFIKICIQKQGENLVIEVHDNGIGIELESKNVIFDVFRRGTSKHPGNGLGLYIVRKHAARLGGHAALISHRDDTVFRVSFPLAI